MNSDADLLRQFAENHDEACFARLVERHLRFVYAVARRRLGDSHAAEDAAQAVFVALARKADRVADLPSVTGWLHRSACYETRNMIRAQTNRRAREAEAVRLGTTHADADPCGGGIESVIDEAMCRLSASDRNVILARFFAAESYRDIGVTMSLTENAARMRVERALTRLRDHLARRGVTSTAAALATALPGYAAANVPGALASAVTRAAIVGATTGAGSAAILAFMSTSKVITIATAAAVAVGGLSYANYQVAQIKGELAAAHAEANSSHEEVARLHQEVSELKRVAAAVTARPAPQSSAASVQLVRAPQPSAPATGVVPKAPTGWAKNGSANDLYEVGVDENNSWGGMPSAYAKSIGAADGKFGGMMQTISADTYKNQRVRLTAWVKTADANDGGGHLWMRVDGASANDTLQFDNMNARAPKGTTDWQEYSVVLDVPPTSTRLNYGFFVAGKGQMWVNGLTIAPVDGTVPSTNMLKPRALPATPVNLGFTPPPST